MSTFCWLFPTLTISCVTFSAVSCTFTEIVTGMFTNVSIIFVTFPEIVAEKKSDWRPCGRSEIKYFISVIKPMSTIRSTSSRTTLLNWERSRTLCFVRSFILPGVPITKLGFNLKLLICLWIFIPPMQRVPKTPRCFANIFSSSKICKASSLVGATISTFSALFFKTFSIRGIKKVLKNKAEKVLIVAPTRELALQIFEELKIFAKHLGVFGTLCIGGMNIQRQISNLRLNPSFVIGTPGRIKDLTKQRVLDLSQFNNVVLDEVDRMVDIGFITDIKYLISLLPHGRQSLFFSATISGKVTEIIETFVNMPVTISVKVQDTAENVTQDIVKVGNHQKVDMLHDLLIKEGFDKVLVFGRTKRGIQ